VFISLLIAMFAVSVVTAAVVARLFDRSIAAILARLVTDEFSVAWQRYIKFAMYVVGISGGVRIWTLEQYVGPRSPTGEVPLLTANRWVLEIYRTILGTLQSIAWVLLAFFLIALVAYVIVRGQEMRQHRAARGADG
jgi:hypothetical protein